MPLKLALSLEIAEISLSRPEEKLVADEMHPTRWSVELNNTNSETQPVKNNSLISLKCFSFFFS